MAFTAPPGYVLWSLIGGALATGIWSFVCFRSPSPYERVYTQSDWTYIENEFPKLIILGTTHCLGPKIRVDMIQEQYSPDIHPDTGDVTILRNNNLTSPFKDLTVIIKKM